MHVLILAYFFFCRYYGRKILHIMYDHPEFDKNVTKHVPSNLQKNVRDTVENLRIKVQLVNQCFCFEKYCVTWLEQKL